MAEFINDIKALFDGQNPQLLLLDLDGTLIDSVPDLAAAVDQMLIALDYPKAVEEHVSHWVGNGADMLIRRALARGDEEQAKSLEAKEVARARQHFDQAYLSALRNATGIFEGVEEFLVSTDIPKALITNKPRLFTMPLIRSLGWESHFARILCGDDLVEKKPSPMPLLHACQWQQTEPENTLMIGDSRNDIRAAKAANIPSVAVTYGYNHGENIANAESDYLCDNLMDLLLSTSINMVASVND